MRTEADLKLSPAESLAHWRDTSDLPDLFDLIKRKKANYWVDTDDI